MTKSKSTKRATSRHSRPKPRHGKKMASATSKATSRELMRRSPAAACTSVADSSKNQPDTKQAQIIAMLCTPSGATIDAMMRLTGWQQHSVRGFLAAVVRKRLGLDLQSEATESGRVYRIYDRVASASADARAKQAA